MVKKYLNASDVRMKLQRSVVFYKKVPHYVDLPPDPESPWDHIRLTPLAGKNKSSFVLPHDDENIDTSAPLLGYINYKGRAYYLSRIPGRVSSQGLKNDVIISNPRNISSSYFVSPEFSDALLGKYPKLDTAEGMLYSLAWSSVAISRTFAIGVKDDLRIGLYQQGNLIGDQVKSGEYTLNNFKGSSFTKKLLEKVGVVL